MAGGNLKTFHFLLDVPLLQMRANTLYESLTSDRINSSVRVCHGLGYLWAQCVRQGLQGVELGCNPAIFGFLIILVRIRRIRAYTVEILGDSYLSKS